MEINYIKFFNYCAYKGEQTINLKTTKSKPVIILGALNGGGKTTILDAIQLCLYGKKATLSKKGTNSYNDFLRSCLHKTSFEKATSAYIEINFKVKSPQISEYIIKRKWTLKNNKIDEKFTVFKNDEKDTWISENWLEYIEDIIPQRLSKLFFFDAEKIQNIINSDDKNAISKSIKSLLGLDIAEKLITDTEIIKKELILETLNKEDSKLIENLEEEINLKIIPNKEQLINEKTFIKTDLEKNESKLKYANTEFSKFGGEQWKNKVQLKSAQGDIELKLFDIKNELIEIVSKDTPLFLVFDKINKIKEKNLNCVNEEQKKYAIKELKKILKKTKDLKNSDKVIEIINHQINLISKNKSPKKSILPTNTLNSMNIFNELYFNSKKEIISKLFKNKKELETKLIEIKRDLNAIPKEEQIASIFQEIKDLEKKNIELQHQLRIKEEEIKSLDNHLKQKERDYARLVEHIYNITKTNNKTSKIKDRIDSSQELISTYINLSVKKKISSLSDSITESFTKLIRKRNFLEKVVIDPITFDITIHKNNGETFSKDKLSEGEKQIFAISFLWGLAKASQKKLPMVIDTPLGRLDTVHRNKLIKSYFPNASHQVIILSTDSEIQEDGYKSLESKISKTYLLDYNEKKEFTSIKENMYFWN